MNKLQFLKAQPGQLQQDRLQPLRIQMGLQGLILMLQQKQETQNLATKITSRPPLGPSPLDNYQVVQMGQLLWKVLQMFGSLPQVDITPRMSTPLEETLQQLGRLQLEETLQQGGRLQLEETLQQGGRPQLEETLLQLGRLQLEETLLQLGTLQLEETLQQLGTLQLEETLLQLGTLQLEETLQQLGRLQLAETSQVGQARSSRIQPLFHQTSALTRAV